MTHRVVLQPGGRRLDVERGTLLKDALAGIEFEFPCGGRGACRGCRVRVLEGHASPTPLDHVQLQAEELVGGWRLACQMVVEGDLLLEARQLEAIILADDRPFAFQPAEGWGVAVDVGTTTLVAQLVDLSQGRVAATATSMNPQGTFGADVMSRVEKALTVDGLAAQRDLVRAEIERMILQVCRGGGHVLSKLTRVVVVGNTVMHHLLLGKSVEALATLPFESPWKEARHLPPSELGWKALPEGAVVTLPPLLGGFVGSDLLGVLLATGLAERAEKEGGVDFGTNGELMVGSREHVWVASTAAGPAFEGGRISMGMRAATGAIDAVRVEGSRLVVHVIGGGTPQGVCGSGLVDAVACGLDLGKVAPSGRLEGGTPWTLVGSVSLSQGDLREIQLAKGAVAAGFRLLLKKAGWNAEALTRLHVAGAFGHALSPVSAARLGLLPVEPGRVNAVGNAALRGAKMCLGAPEGGRGLWEKILPLIEHVPLASSPEFHEAFTDQLSFPA